MQEQQEQEQNYDMKKYQSAFRERMAKQQFSRKEIWIDSFGFPVSARELQHKKKDGNIARDKKDLNEMISEVKKLTAPIEESVRQEIYAELLRYAASLRARWDEKQNTDQ